MKARVTPGLFCLPQNLIEMSHHQHIHKLKRDLIRTYAAAYSLADAFDVIPDDEMKRVNSLHTTVRENETWLSSIVNYKRVKGDVATDVVEADSGRDDRVEETKRIDDIRTVMRRQLGEFLHLMALAADDDDSKIILSFENGTEEETADFIARRVNAMNNMLPRPEDPVDTRVE